MPVLPDWTAVDRVQANPGGGAVSYRPNQGPDVGAGIQAGRDLQQAAAIIAESNQRQDTVLAQSKANDLARVRAKLEYDPNGGLRSVQGEGVTKPEFVETYTQKFKDASQTLRDTLTSDSQKAMFDRHVEVQGLQYQSSLLQHQAVETKRFNVDTLVAQRKNIGDELARDPKNQDLWMSSLVALNDNIGKWAKLNGYSEAQSQEFKNEQFSAAAVTRVLALAHGDPTLGREPDPDGAMALAASKVVQDSLTAHGRDVLDKQMMPVITATKGEQIGRGVVTAFDFRNTGKAFAFIDGMDAPVSVKEAAKHFVSTQHTALRQDYNDNQGEAMGRVGQALYAAPGRSAISRAQMIASADFVALDDKNKAAALEMYDRKTYSDMLRGQAGDARAVAALQRQEHELHLKGAAAAYDYMDPARLSNVSRADILQQLPVLGQQWVEEILTRKKQLESADATEVKVDHDDMMAAMSAAGLRPFEKSKTEEGKALLSETQSRIERALTIAKQGGKVLGREDKLRIMREESARSVSVGTWYGGTNVVPIMELTPDQIKKVIVPPQEWAPIRAEMADLYKRSNGRMTQFEPTEENLKRYYLTYRKGSLTAPMIPAVPQ